MEIVYSNAEYARLGDHFILILRVIKPRPLYNIAPGFTMQAEKKIPFSFGPH